MTRAVGSAIAGAVVFAVAGFSALLALWLRAPLPPPPAAPAADEPSTRHAPAPPVVKHPAPSREPLTLLFTGDVMVGRFVETLTDAQGLDYPFRRISSTLASADAIVSNLEGPILAGHEPVPYTSYQFSFASSTPATLAKSGFSYLSLANNHAGDHGSAGLAETRSYLREAGIEPFGEPYRTATATVAYIETPYRRIALVGLNATGPQAPMAEAVRVVDELRKGSPELFVVVFAHWGDEYALSASDLQRGLAHKLVDAGADLVLGSHPHVVQDVEAYRGSLIFYSLGNFIFDQYFSEDTQRGLLVKLTLSGASESYELLPVMSVRSQPALMSGAARAEFLELLADRSDAQLKDVIRNGELKMGEVPN